MSDADEATQAAAAEKAAADKAAADKAARVSLDPLIKDVDPNTLQVNALLAKARSDEKDKLHSRVTSAEKAAEEHKTLALAATEREKALNERLAALTADAEKAKTKKAGEPAPIDEAKITSIVEGLSKRLSDEAAKRESALQEQIAALIKENQGAKLDSFRTKALAEAGTDLIPELVTGTTPDEIVASIAQSKIVFKAVADRLKLPAETRRAAHAAATTVPLPSVNPGPDGRPTGTVTNVDPSTMSRKDFAKNRDALLRAANDHMKQAIAAEVTEG